MQSRQNENPAKADTRLLGTGRVAGHRFFSHRLSMHAIQRAALQAASTAAPLPTKYFGDILFLGSTMADQLEMTSLPTPLASKQHAALLTVQNMTVRFGGITALDAVTFAVAKGTICGLIGPNGAGKTTLFNCLSRIYRFESGEFFFEGRAMSSVPVHRIAAFGIGRTFQNVALFRTLTVLENIMLGGHERSRGGFLANALKLPFVRKSERELRARARTLGAFVGLDTMLDRKVADLPFAFQKRVELARALATAPKLLLLDEPAAGLNHEELKALTAVVVRIRDEMGVTVLLVEHHMNMVMEISDKVVVLSFGRKIADGSPAEVRADPEVVRAYLGSQG